MISHQGPSLLLQAGGREEGHLPPSANTKPTPQAWHGAANLADPGRRQSAASCFSESGALQGFSHPRRPYTESIVVSL